MDTLLESELFGHEKGAFTGAVAAKPGRFQQAQDGTLFLDEIGELAPPLQAKLLRALQEQVVEPVGGTRPVPVNCRIIAATHRDLFEQVREGQFREDLAYRLEVISIHLPALRERPEDIPLLIRALLERAASRMERAVPPLTAEAEQRLLAHPWPGNVRELENVLTQALVQARDGMITAEMIRFHAHSAAEKEESAPRGEGAVAQPGRGRGPAHPEGAGSHRRTQGQRLPHPRDLAPRPGPQDQKVRSASAGVSTARSGSPSRSRILCLARSRSFSAASQPP